MPSETEREIEQHLNRTPALSLRDMDSKVLAAFITDMAQNIFSYDEISQRYGLSMATMLDIVRRDGIAQQIKARRAVFTSGDSVQERTKTLYGLIAMDAASRLDQVIHDPATPIGAVLDGLTLAARNAGVYNSGSQKTDIITPMGGAQFAVNITFAGAKGATIETTAAQREAVTIDGSAEG